MLKENNSVSRMGFYSITLILVLVALCGIRELWLRYGVIGSNFNVII